MTTCKFCGQVILDGKECTCDGAVAERKKQNKIRQASALLKETFADDGESYIPAGTVDVLISVLPMIADEDFKKVTIQLDGGIKASVKLNSNGKIEIERTDTLKVKNETQS